MLSEAKHLYPDTRDPSVASTLLQGNMPVIFLNDSNLVIIEILIAEFEERVVYNHAL